MSNLPEELQVNAFAPDAENVAPIDPALKTRLLTIRMVLPDGTAAPIPIDPKDWRDPRVGWGVLVADDPLLATDAKAAGLDLPDAIRMLLDDRNGVVVRYDPAAAAGMLRRYYTNGTAQDIFATAQAWGTGIGQIPRYLLMLGSPAQLPWSLQFFLQSDYFVGRLDLSGPALDSYVSRLLDDWAGTTVRPLAPIIWATSQNGDITRLMRNSIAEPLHQRFADDTDLAPTFIDGSSMSATGTALAAALQAQTPGLVVTTSHGMTGPLSDPVRLRADLGLLVDGGFSTISPNTLTAGWDPGGVIWYAHACCSAGSRAKTSFDGLVVPGSGVDRILRAVAACGDTIAPFPQALLSAPTPAKAFIGHVEPTFDWSVRHHLTGQFLTNPLLDSLYQRLFSKEPVGMALDSCRRMASGLLNAYHDTYINELNQGQSRAGEILALKLMANDWRSFVLLGDPACRLL